MTSTLLGIDIGTSACKVDAYDLEGELLASSSAAYSTYYPQPGHAEQEPNDWISAVRDALRILLASGRVKAADIVSVGVDGQSWACVPVDSAGEVLARTPIWHDRRAEALCGRMLERVDEDVILALSGNPWKPSYTTPKVLWFQENVPSVYRSAKYFLQSNSFVVHALTGAYSQDESQSYGLHTVNIASGQYDDEMHELMGLDRRKFPDIVRSDEVVGTITRAAASLTGLIEGTPVVAGGLDAACASLGAGVYLPGQTQEQGGQAGGMSVVTDAPFANRKLILSRHVVPGTWLLQGGTVGGSASLKWLVEQVGLAEEFAGQASGKKTYEVVSELAATVRAGSDGLTFLPYLSGERSPIWDPSATGVLFGLTFDKTRAHLYRSVMEGVAFSLQHNIITANQAGVPVQQLHATGGAAESALWTQIKADVTGIPIVVPSVANASSLGAAILAGLGVGAYSSFGDAVRRTTRIRRTHRPDLSTTVAYRSSFNTYLELYERLKDLMSETTLRSARDHLS